MSDWEDIRHFVALAREGTLSAAARTLGVDHATVARRVAALEASTGLKLVDRRARATTLTEHGRRIAAVAAPMEEAAFALSRTAQAAKPGIDGEVTISAPPNFASAVIAPQLVRLRQQHPGIRIKLIGEKRKASLGRREADLAGGKRRQLNISDLKLLDAAGGPDTNDLGHGHGFFLSIL